MNLKDYHKEIFNINPLLIKLLEQRGIETEDKLNRFFYPSISHLCPIEKYEGAARVAQRLEQAIIDGEIILIYGDYDCDGICSASILYLYLKNRGVNVYSFIPNRHNDGYGINIDSVATLKERYNPSIMITVDCGISSLQEIDYIKKNLDIEVIVTDHHIPPSELPKCLIFNPKIERLEVYRDLSGAGVVLRLIEAMSGTEEMLKYIDIACLSTIADVVPLTEDNRVIVSLGINILKSNPRKGIDLLAKRVKCSYSASDIAFRIVPAINASGRLGDANKVLELFISDDYFMLSTIVRDICNDNTLRKQITESVFNESLEMLDNYDLINNRLIMLYKEDWDIGILGIVAARLARDFRRPVILLSLKDGLLKGSGRSYSSLDLYSILNKYIDKYISFGGHAQAVGITINKTNYYDLIGLINKDLEGYNPTLEDDYIFLDNPVNYSLFKDLARLEPFGCCNEKPQFSLNNEFKFAPINNTPHLKANVSNNIEIIGFNMIDNIALLNSRIKSSFVVDMNINNYNGYGQYIINDIKYLPSTDESDYTISKYLKQSLYKKTKINYKICTLEQLSNVLDKSYGNLLIASSINTCYNILKRYNNLEFYVDNKKILDPRNAIVLSPSLSTASRYYERIIVLDRPLNDGYIELFKHKNIKEIYLLDNKYSINYPVMDTDKANNIINNFVKISSKYNLKSLDEAYYRVREKMECSYLEFSWIFYIMYEMKVLNVIKKRTIIINNINEDIRAEILRRLDEYRAI